MRIEEIEEIEEIQPEDEDIHDRQTPLDIKVSDIWDDVTPFRSQSGIRMKVPLPPPRPKLPTSIEVLHHITYVGESAIVVDTKKTELSPHERLYARLWEGTREETEEETEELSNDWFANPKLRLLW